MQVCLDLGCTPRPHQAIVGAACGLKLVYTPCPHPAIVGAACGLELVFSHFLSWIRVGAVSQFILRINKLYLEIIVKGKYSLMSSNLVMQTVTNLSSLFR